jgi:hypothetical protein
MKRELLSKGMILRSAMTLAIVMLTATGAWAYNKKEITYVDRTWDETNKVVVSTPKSVEAYNLADFLPATNPSEDAKISIYNGGYYYLEGNLDFSNCTLMLEGASGSEYHIILCDGADVKLNHLSMWGWKQTLHVYGQANETGCLTVNGKKSVYVVSKQITDDIVVSSGISISSNKSSDGRGQFHFHGGKIFTYGGEGGSGIGMDCSAGAYDEDIYIYGGQIWAEGGYHGTGIADLTQAVHIYGGNITAKGGDLRAGIGGYAESPYGYASTHSRLIEIYDGTVHATGGDNSAGIGGSKNSGGAPVNIYGGNVYANGGKNAAGIGGGRNASSNRIKISGGKVIANGGDYAAGIGSGINGEYKFDLNIDPNDDASYIISITGGEVEAYGGVDAAGIGGGEDGNSGWILIKGGKVTARSTGEDSNGAGIGGGEDGKVDCIKITGGEVYATGGEGKGWAIGSNLSGSDGNGTLILGDNLKVYASADPDNIERCFTNSERVAACHYRRHAEISTCTHVTPTKGGDTTAPLSYTIGENSTHNVHCRYCNFEYSELHNFVNNVCDKCGKEYNSDEDECTVTIYEAVVNNGNATYNAGKQYRVVKGKSFNIPEMSAVEGLNLLALVKDPAPAPSSVWLTDTEKANKTNFIDPKAVFTPTANTAIYARYRHDFTTQWTWTTDIYGDINTETDCVTLTISCPAYNGGNVASFSGDKINVRWEKTDEAANEKIYSATFSQELVPGVTYTFTDTKHVALYDTDLTLYDNQTKNSKKIYEYDTQAANVTIQDRVLYRDGSWNTIFLPFALSQTQLANEDCPLHGATIKKLSSSKFSNGTLTLNFETVEATEAGTPYIVKWTKPNPYVAYTGENAGTCSDIVNPVFKDATIAYRINYTLTDKVLFMGSFNTTTIEQTIVDQKAVLYLGADNKLYYPNAVMTFGAFRGYFLLNGLTAGDLEQSVRAFVLNFDGEQSGDDITTGIRSLTPDSSLMGEGSGYYSLDGRKLDTKPTAKGVYIYNGKKRVIK